ncbi:hypothetical protein GYMLUDRAFT_208315 [Collybiopsis luxurians FD-317 M1]|uniref:Phosphoglycerate mutase-like protein n=1 Tax=Collybiopsis luxurians FD-317 M1 TaxID=944289 RepID=A0A0D0BR30_9AGAR|nr:hypothetical protein GYMLUDRAFT_208315 [Collybiopsis luxurians FD-317 M1]
MVTLTFIRHGQSTDNVKKVWAGWKDAPLSNHGMKQATALGRWFSEKGIRFTAILSSPLDRAATTAEAILEHQPEPKPPHIKSTLLREQHFGIAEGKPWATRKDPNLSLEDHFAQGMFPSPPKRSDRFPGGESRDDLAARAEQAINELLLPYFWGAEGENQGPIHVAVVSHGLFIREIVDALYRREWGRERMLENYRGLSNTGWTRVVVTLKGTQYTTSSPKLSVRITAVNEREHLDNLVRQKGGIAGLAHDPRQKDIRGFFAGKP